MAGGFIDPYGFSKGSKSAAGGSSGYIDPYGFAKPPKMPKPPKPHGGGGIFGSIGHALGSAAHWTGGKVGLAAHDVAAMPGGIYNMGKAAVEPGHVKGGLSGLGHEWSEFIQHPLRSYSDTASGKFGTGEQRAALQVGGMAKGTAQSIRHPLRDPFQSLLTIGGAAGAGAGAVARAGAAANVFKDADEAGLASRAAEASKALTQKPSMPLRQLHVPTLVKDEAGNLNVVHQPAHLVEAHAPLARAAQALHDKILQRSLDANLTAEKPSMMHGYAMSRVGKASSEEARIGLNTRNLATQQLGSVKGFDKGVERGHGQLALFLRSANVLPHEASEFWKSQADAGVNPVQTLRLSKWAKDIDKRGLLHTDESGRVSISGESYPKLASADNLVKANQATREQIIHEHNLMSPEGVAARKALVAETMHSEAARNLDTGVREGQGYTPLAVSEKAGPLSPFAKGRSPIIPQAKAFSLSHEATGEGVRAGNIPDNTTAGVAHATRAALRYLGSDEHRAAVYKYGSDVRRTKNDVLVADPEAQRLGEIPLETKQLLGREHSTLGTLAAKEDAGIAAAMKAKLEDAIPSRSSEQAKRLEADSDIGTEAPGGYRWVPRQTLGSLVHETTPRGGVVRLVNDVNSAVTAATVYFKLGHIPQRLATNAATSVLNGALMPENFRFAIELRKQLSQQEYGELAAATGTHGYNALPHEGTSKLATAASRGAGFYAHRVDSPFRFLNLVHEARAGGVDSVEGFRSLIRAAKDPAKADDRQLSILKRANRVSMIYDGLGPNEQRYIARGIWFYPWTKASVRFAGHTIAEHPLASAAGAALGVAGRKEQAHDLGKVPYYEQGLTSLGGNEVFDPSSLSPFSTAANVLQTPEHLDELRGNLNPVSSAGIDVLAGTNSFGEKQNRGAAALGDLTSPTPEAQIIAGLLHRHQDQSHKMFPNGGGLEGAEAPLLRAIFGASFPRKINKKALHEATEKWRTIEIPNG